MALFGVTIYYPRRQMTHFMRKSIPDPFYTCFKLGFTIKEREPHPHNPKSFPPILSLLFECHLLICYNVQRTAYRKRPEPTGATLLYQQ